MQHLELMQAQQAILSGLYNDAIAILDSSMHLSELPEYWHLRAIADIMRGDNYRAIKELKRALELEDDPRYKYDLALAHWGLGEVDNAVELLKEVLHSLPYASLTLMSILWQSGALESLEEVLADILFHPESYSMPIIGYANYFMALLSLYLGNLKASYKHSLTCYKLLPNFKGNKVLLSMLLMKAKRYQEAERILKSISSDEDDVNVSYMRAMLSLLRDEHSETIMSSLEKLLAKSPDNPNLWYLLGYVSLMRREVSRAKNYFKGSFVIDNSDVDYRNAFAVTVALSGDTRKAIALLERGDEESYPSYVKENLSKLRDVINS